MYNNDMTSSYDVAVILQEAGKGRSNLYGIERAEPPRRYAFLMGRMSPLPKKSRYRIGRCAGSGVLVVWVWMGDQGVCGVGCESDV